MRASEVVFIISRPNKPTQNACLERFNRSCRHEVLDAHLFGSLSQVRDIVHNWIISYNEERPHAALENLPPTVFRKQRTPKSTTKPKAPNSTFEMYH